MPRETPATGRVLPHRVLKIDCHAAHPVEISHSAARLRVTSAAIYTFCQRAEPACQTSSSTLVTETDEARRDFETHPSSSTQSRTACRWSAIALFCELYHVVWHFNPVCAAAASRIGGRAASSPLPPVRAHARGVRPRAMGAQRSRGGRRGREARCRTIGRPRTCSRLIGYNYWAADRRHPCSVLGMMYALEVIASVYGGPFAVGDQGVAALARAIAASRSSARTRRWTPSTWPSCGRS